MSNTSGDDINSFLVRGNIGRIKFSATPHGRTVVSLGVATHRFVRDIESAGVMERTEWHDVVAFDAVADSIRASSAEVGSRVEFSGYMRTREWKDAKTETTKYRHELVATQFSLVTRTQSSAAETGTAAVPEKDVGMHIPEL